MARFFFNLHEVRRYTTNLRVGRSNRSGRTIYSNGLAEVPYGIRLSPTLAKFGEQSRSNPVASTLIHWDRAPSNAPSATRALSLVLVGIITGDERAPANDQADTEGEGDAAHE